MKQQSEWAVFAFLSVLTILRDSVIGAGFSSAIILSGIGASLILVPLWAIIGLGFFGGLLGLLNLFRSEIKLKFSMLTKANMGIALGLVLKLVIPSLP